MRDDARFYMCGPFMVERVGENPYLCSYRAWLPSDPAKVWEFESARALGNFFEDVCAQYLREANA